ncbi:Inward rectifier potassium channel 2 [Hondaea fermentalgiana]|uniref:Inward rectifier potassium channel 2 n=1 Tax=Hondaea fermentalgiana TaxID=2315210 RepID=A0A2R5GF62_9STRA|nr:Inward rectifier potassium channel 2 [Hondaea fermentalgiana]|eukprot:GBG26881.1 Inward rectifier potassium channel 2 [Hondaea fermentalgiana]
MGASSSSARDEEAARSRKGVYDGGSDAEHGASFARTGRAGSGRDHLLGSESTLVHDPGEEDRTRNNDNNGNDDDVDDDGNGETEEREEEEDEEEEGDGDNKGEEENKEDNALVEDGGELPLRTTSMRRRKKKKDEIYREESVENCPRSASEVNFGTLEGIQRDQPRRNHTHAIGMSLADWRRFRVERLRKKHKHSYKQRKYLPDHIESGKRKKRSALHGTGASKWYEAKNWYYVLLDWSWAFVFFLSALSYLLMCLLWSLVSWILSDEIECESGEDIFIPGTFGSAFVFATSNILTLGYGPCLPGSYGLYVLSCVQQFAGIMLNVIVLSVVVSKFQIPKPDIVFSKKALVTTRDGEPTLLIRVGNRRVNLVYETRVSVNLLRFHETTEGENFVGYDTLETSFPPIVTAVATIIHKIDEQSPLRRFLLDPEEMANIVLSVSFSGHDSVYNDLLVCTTQYRGTDLELGGILFGNMMERRPGGKGIRANFDKFDGVEAAVGVTHERLMEALHALEDSDDDEVEDLHQLQARRASKSQARRLASGLRSQGRSTRVGRIQGRDTTLRNDATHAAVVTTLPDDPLVGTVYLCYGCIRIKNYLARMCPYSRMVYMFLIVAGIPHQVIDIDWNAKPSWFTEAVPTGRTPTIYYEGKWTHNSRDIMRYLHRKFPAQAKRANRTHDLPVATWSFFDVLERHVHLVIFSSPEKMREMLAMNPEEARGKIVLNIKAAGAGNMDEVLGSDQSRLKRLRQQRKVKERPPANGSRAFLCIGVGHRGDRLVRNCPSSQKVEMVMRALGIPHSTVLVDAADPPTWVGPDQVPMLLGPGPDERVTVGDKAILDVLHELYRADFDRLPRRTSYADVFRICEELEAATDAYMMRPDGSGVEPQRNEVDAKCLATLLNVLQPLETILAENEATDNTREDTKAQTVTLTWYPFLSGAREVGLDDLILAPHLHYCLERVLRPMAGFCAERHGLSRLQRYVTAMARTALMRETSETEGATPFYVLNAAAHYERKFPAWQPLRCRSTVARKAAEEDMVTTLMSSYGKDTICVAADGSVSVKGGMAGPSFEMNKVYLAIGCVHRDEFLTKVCPFSRVVEMVAIEAGVPHHTVKIDLLDKPAWFTEASSTGKCPSIYWNGVWTNESQIVLNTMQRLFTQRYATLDKPLRLEGVSRVDGCAEMALFNACDAICEAYLKAKTNDPTRAAKRREMCELLGAMETQLADSGGPFLLGPTCAVADVALVTSIWRIVKVCCAWFHGFELTAEGFPRVNAWVDQFSRRESFKRSMPEFAEPFLILFTAKFHGDAQDVEHSPLQVTALVRQNERDAVAKLRLQEFGSLAHREGQNMLHLAQMESILKVLDDLLAELEASSLGEYLCGEEMGLADILVFSHLFFIEMGVQCVHQVSLLDRGFPHVRNFVKIIVEDVRFRELFSPAFKELLRIHFADRLSDRFPFLKLAREEREHLEFAAVELVTAHKKKVRRKSVSKQESRKPSALRWEGQSVSSLTSESQSSSGGSTSTGDIEDLLFCI